MLAQIGEERTKTLAVLDGLTAADLDRVDPGTGWTVRQLLAHAAVGQMGEAFFIRAAGAGQVIEMQPAERDDWNATETARAEGWDVHRLRTEFDEAWETIQEAFAELSPAQLENPIRWPSYPATTIWESRSHIAEHQAEHRSQVERALGRA